MKESQGVERSRIKIKGGIRTKKGVHPSTPMGNFLPEREEWNRLKALSEKAGVEEWDYEQKIDRHIDLSHFRKLVSIYVIGKKTSPSSWMLAKLFRDKRSPDEQIRLNQRMVKAWKEAQEEFEILGTREASFTPKKKGNPGPKGPRKASANRRTAIKLLKKEGFIGLQACKKLKSMKVPCSPSVFNFFMENSVGISGLLTTHEPSANSGQPTSQGRVSSLNL